MSLYPRWPLAGASMDPAAFVRTLWKYKHPQWTTIGIVTNRWGNRQREHTGLVPHGTIWVATPQIKILEAVPMVVCDSIPYARLMTGYWDEKTMRFIYGPVFQGWSVHLKGLLAAGYLRPSRELSRLLNANSFGFYHPFDLEKSDER